MATETMPRPRSDEVWKRADVTAFYQQSRKGIPYVDDHFEIVHRVLDAHGLVVENLLDLGCGDGIATQQLMARDTVRRATLLDFSEPMLEMARENLAEVEIEATVGFGDLADPSWHRDSATRVPFDLIVSRFAIHHLPDERKRELYGEILQLLRPGGVFVNIEHVKSASKVFQRAFDKQLVEGIHAADLEGRSAEEIEAAYHARQDGETNILAPVEDQLAWLRELGYEDVDCHFKAFELAVFSGRRAHS